MWYHLILLLVLHQELRYFFLLLSIFTDELILASKIKTFFRMIPSANEKSYAFTDPNKQFFKVKSVFKFVNHS